jgi:hypothetical protein
MSRYHATRLEVCAKLIVLRSSVESDGKGGPEFEVHPESVYHFDLHSNPFLLSLHHH